MSKESPHILFWADDLTVQESQHGDKEDIIIHHPDVIMMVILTKGGYVVLQQNHRLGTDREELTLPYSISEEIEKSSVEIESLLKKINVESQKITLIHSLSAFPDKFSPLYHVYFIYDATVKGDLPKEFVLTSLQQYEGLITQGKLSDAVTITALQLVKSKFYELTDGVSGKE